MEQVKASVLAYEQPHTVDFMPVALKFTNSSEFSICHLKVMWISGFRVNEVVKLSNCVYIFRFTGSPYTRI